jgi:HD superfamily phosphodiesterase
VGQEISVASLLEARLNENTKLGELHARAKAIPAADAAHDFSHVLRVAKLTTQIFSSEIRVMRQRYCMIAFR